MQKMKNEINKTKYDKKGIAKVAIINSRFGKMCRKRKLELCGATTVSICILMVLLALQQSKIVEEKSTGNMKTFPGVVIEQMSVEYWLKKLKNPDRVLLNREQIEALNTSIIEEDGTEMYDLVNEPRTVNGKANQPVVYLICTTRSNLMAYPTDELQLESEDDPDLDENQLSAIRVNEPMVAMSISEDRKYYFVHTSNCSGWVKADTVAVCKSKEQWLHAWQIDHEEALVVTGTEIHLAYSNAVPEISNCMLSMGTVLRLIPEEEVPTLLNNRATYYNYVVELPIRKADGSYATRMAMVAQNCEVNAGFLPLTQSNILKQAFQTLGNVYGWGGMLNSNDCSGYMRDVYKCFGLELPRNTQWQQAIPSEKYEMSALSIKEKKKLLNKLPAGTILFFDGHEMMYLGKDRGDYYVISATGSVMNQNQTEFQHLRSVSINPLCTTRRENRVTWIDSLTMAVIPFSIK